MNNQQKTQEIIDKYQGTCLSMDDEDCDFLYIEYPEGGVEFDNYHFLCAECGWWMETHEQSETYTDEEFCIECKP